MRVGESGVEPRAIKTGFFGTLFCLCFLLSPLLSNLAGVGKFSLGDMAIFFSLVISIFSLRSIGVFCMLGLVSILLLSCICLFAYMDSYPEGVFVLARMALYVACFFIFLTVCKRPGFASGLMRVYLRLAVLFSMMLVVQVVSYHLFGIVFVYLVTPLDIQPNSVLGLDIATQGFRSGGVFKEPSYFSVFVAPAVIYAASRRHYLLWCLISSAIVLSTSSLGFIFIALSLLRFFNAIYLVVLLPIGLALGTLVLTGIIPILPDRVMETLEGGGSLSIRVVEPFSRVFLDTKSLFLPNVEALRDLADPVLATKIWFNSFTYAVVV